MIIRFLRRRRKQKFCLRYRGGDYYDVLLWSTKRRKYANRDEFGMIHSMAATVAEKENQWLMEFLATKPPVNLKNVRA